jgi:hypothetical protein
MRTRFKIMAAAMLALGFVVAPLSKAQVVNGGFETGSLSPWTAQGDVSVQGSDFNPIGNDIAFLNNDASGNNVFDGTAAITNVGTLDSFSNLAAGTLEADGVTSGSVMKQTFSATAGNTISFTYNFLTNEPGAAGNQDFAYYTLSGPGIGTVTVNMLANPTAPAGSPPPLAANESGIYDYLSAGTNTETGNLSTSFAIATSGTYTLTFGVTNVGDLNGTSGLLVDAVTGATSSGGGGGSSVPLPAAALLAPAAMALAGRYSKKLRKQA